MGSTWQVTHALMSSSSSVSQPSQSQLRLRMLKKQRTSLLPCKSNNLLTTISNNKLTSLLLRALRISPSRRQPRGEVIAVPSRPIFFSGMDTRKRSTSTGGMRCRARTPSKSCLVHSSLIAWRKVSSPPNSNPRSSTGRRSPTCPLESTLQPTKSSSRGREQASKARKVRKL